MADCADSGPFIQQQALTLYAVQNAVGLNTKMQPWLLVCPSSRGIGLALSRRLLRTTNLPLVATARSDLEKSKEAILSKDGGADPAASPRAEIWGEATGEQEERLKIIKVDVQDEDSMAEAAAECNKLFPTKPSQSNAPAQATQPSHLHSAFIIPGILHAEKSPAQLDHDQILSTFQINTIGPMLMLKHFSSFLPRKSAELPLLSEDEFAKGVLPRNATWATMSARVGSITDNNLGGWYSYRASKAAVNQLTKSFDNHLRTFSGDNAIAVSLHPGTVKTGLSKDFWGNVKDEKLFSPEFAAERLINVVGECGPADRGRCWDWEGKEVPP